VLVDAGTAAGDVSCAATGASPDAAVQALAGEQATGKCRDGAGTCCYCSDVSLHVESHHPGEAVDMS
jgi:hypothetical protein